MIEQIPCYCPAVVLCEASKVGCGAAKTPMTCLFGAYPWMGQVKDAYLLVVEERLRQIDVEGYNSYHDDLYISCELTKAAACYALAPDGPHSGIPPLMWPWEAKYWKPSSYKRNLVKAGALTLAEIQRAHRLNPTARTEDDRLQRILSKLQNLLSPPLTMVLTSTNPKSGEKEKGEEVVINKPVEVPPNETLQTKDKKKKTLQRKALSKLLWETSELAIDCGITSGELHAVVSDVLAYKAITLSKGAFGCAPSTMMLSSNEQARKKAIKQRLHGVVRAIRMMFRRHGVKLD